MSRLRKDPEGIKKFRGPYKKSIGRNGASSALEGIY